MGATLECNGVAPQHCTRYIYCYIGLGRSPNTTYKYISLVKRKVIIKKRVAALGLGRSPNTTYYNISFLLKESVLLG